MSVADGYRKKAAEFTDKAKAAKNPAQQLEHAMMAAAYLRLAEHADCNAMNEVAYETPAEQERSQG